MDKKIDYSKKIVELDKIYQDFLQKLEELKKTRQSIINEIDKTIHDQKISEVLNKIKNI